MTVVNMCHKLYVEIGRFLSYREDSCYGEVPEFCNPPLFSYKRSSNFKDKLIKSGISDLKEKCTTKRLDSFPCMSYNNCGLMIKGSVFKHPVTGNVYKIQHMLTCRYKFVIYVLQCPCPLLNVGETTTECRIRLNNHRSTILTQKQELPAPRHFVECGHRFKIYSDWSYSPLQRGGKREKIFKQR